MGRRGPRPEPAAVKEAKGNPGNRRIGKDPAVKADAADPKNAVDAPDWLKGEGLALWKKLAPRLEQMNILRKLDAPAFGRYCRNFARWLKMQKTLDSEGETYESESPHGTYKRAHPAFLIGDRLERQLVAAEANFGLNPAERQRLFAARAAAGAAGGLFDEPDGVTKPAQPSAPAPVEPPRPEGVVGLLN
jgi:P27 family predicted phage terminase small subunit